MMRVTGLYSNPGPYSVYSGSQAVRFYGARGIAPASGGSTYPDPSDVRFGVVYGPGGIYTGTLVVSSGSLVLIFDD